MQLLLSNNCNLLLFTLLHTCEYNFLVHYIPTYGQADRERNRQTDRRKNEWIDRQTGQSILFTLMFYCYRNYLIFICLFPLRSPGLVNFELLDDLPNLPKYKGIKTPTVEIIGDLAHV